MSLVAFAARNHPQQAVRGDVDDRRTPVEFFAKLHAEHRFTVDAAASAANAQLPRYWTAIDDALSLPWGGERVWCNPPYSQPLLGRFVEKAWTEMVDGTCALVVMLLPANRCEQPFWHEHVEPYRDGLPFHGVRLTSRFLPGRLRFDPPDLSVWKSHGKKGHRPPFGCVLLIWTRAEP